jgi:hypothetical protein
VVFLCRATIIVANNRVIFNIKGNDFRLVVSVNFRQLAGPCVLHTIRLEGAYTKNGAKVKTLLSTTFGHIYATLWLISRFNMLQMKNQYIAGKC